MAPSITAAKPAFSWRRQTCGLNANDGLRLRKNRPKPINALTPDHGCWEVTPGSGSPRWRRSSRRWTEQRPRKAVGTGAWDLMLNGHPIRTMPIPGGTLRTTLPIRWRGKRNDTRSGSAGSKWRCRVPCKRSSDGLPRLLVIDQLGKRDKCFLKRFASSGPNTPSMELPLLLLCTKRSIRIGANTPKLTVR